MGQWPRARSALRAALEPAGASATFVLAGAHAGRRYRIGLDSGATRVESATAGSLRRTEVTAPAEDVVLLFDAAYVGVDVSASFRPLAGALVSITSGEREIETGTDGRAGCFVPPDRDYALEVTAKGCEPARAALHAGHAGSLVRARVELRHVEPGAALDLSVRAEGLDKIDFVRVRFEAADGGSAFCRDAFADHDCFHFQQLPAGSLRVRIELAAQAIESRAEVPRHVAGHELCDAESEIELADGTDGRARSRAAPGRQDPAARARLAWDAAARELRDPRPERRCGRLRAGRARPRDVDRLAVRQASRRRAGAPARGGPDADPGRLRRDGAGAAARPLRRDPPPSGFGPTTTAIEVRAGRLSEVDATLTRLP